MPCLALDFLQRIVDLGDPPLELARRAAPAVDQPVDLVVQPDDRLGHALRSLLAAAGQLLRQPGQPFLQIAQVACSVAAPPVRDVGAAPIRRATLAGGADPAEARRQLIELIVQNGEGRRLARRIRRRLGDLSGLLDDR